MILTFDTETAHSPDEVEGGWNNLAGLGISCACTMEDDSSFFSYRPTPERLAALTTALESAEICVSFNGIAFDIPLLSTVQGRPVSVARHVDLCVLVEASLGHRLSLDVLCKATLGLCKSGHGTHAPKLFQEGRWDELVSYCGRDVWLTWKLFCFAKDHGFLVGPRGTVIPLEVPGGVRGWVAPEPRPESRIEPATEKQIAYLQRLRPGWLPMEGMTKKQASDLIGEWQKERAA